MKHLGFLVCFLFLFSLVQCTPLVYRPYKLPQQEYPSIVQHKRNAELINGLIGMDINRLHNMGKRNAELVNGLIGMDLKYLNEMG